MTNENDNLATEIERFLKPKAVSSRKLARSAEGRLLLAEESALDMDRIRDSGITLSELGRRVRMYNSDMTKQTASYIIPVEVAGLGKPERGTIEGTKIQIGRVIDLGGLYVRHNPGMREVGLNDRGDVVLRQDADTAEDPRIGPILNSYNTTQSTLTDRVVARIDKKNHDRDVKEARAWLDAMNAINDGKTLRARFLSGGVPCEHRGNVQQLYKTVQVNFYQINDPLNLELSSVLEERFSMLERPVPMVRVISVVGIPPNERSYKEFVAQLKKKKQNPMALGLPSRLRDSQFFDSASKSILPSCFIWAANLDEIGDSIYVITINTDYHGEVKGRGVHSGVASALSMADVISAHASSTVLNSDGTTTVIMGSAGSGKSTAAAFWAERNNSKNRDELARRYSLLEQDEEKAKEKVRSVGYIGQDDWLHVVPSGEGKWDVWPAERHFYSCSRDLLSRSLVLSENEPIIENATADFGANGDRESLGRTNHQYPHERLFYDPDWDNFYADRDVHRVSSLVLLEHDPDLDFAVRHVSPKHALEFVLRGRTPSGKQQPFYNDYTDVSALLISQGVVGDRLMEAYRAAKKGDVAALMNGDEALGRFVLDRLKAQLSVWEVFLHDVPVFVVNTVHGADMTHDLIWLVSELPDLVKRGKEKSPAEVGKLMETRFKVSYDEVGDWASLG